MSLLNNMLSDDPGCPLNVILGH